MAGGAAGVAGAPEPGVAGLGAAGPDAGAGFPGVRGATTPVFPSGAAGVVSVGAAVGVVAAGADVGARSTSGATGAGEDDVPLSANAIAPMLNTPTTAATIKSPFLLPEPSLEVLGVAV